MPRRQSTAHLPRQDRRKIEGTREPLDGSFHLGAVLHVNNTGPDSLLLADEPTGRAIEEIKAGENATLGEARWAWSPGRARITVGERLADDEEQAA